MARYCQIGYDEPPCWMVLPAEAVRFLLSLPIEMPIFALQLRANLVGVTELRPTDYPDHRWYMKLKCCGCGDVTGKWQYASPQETHELTKGRGVCHLLANCGFCGRRNSLEILPDSYRSYMVEKNEEFQTIVEFDCRGLEPANFEPRGGWKCVGDETGTQFDEIDLNEKEWVDYDEKAGRAVEINELVSRFVKK